VRSKVAGVNNMVELDDMVEVEPVVEVRCS
jgi:hypothetical protein